MPNSIRLLALLLGVNLAPFLHASPGHWRIATDWADGWPTAWHNVEATGESTVGEWRIVTGRLTLPTGTWELRDAYRPASEPGTTEIRRRWHWTGEEQLDRVTLSFVLELPGLRDARPFLPGISYYDNPAGQKVDATRIPVIVADAPAPPLFAEDHREPGDTYFEPSEEVTPPVSKLHRGFYEEHRYPLPFAAIEGVNEDTRHTFALHTVPSPARYGKREDQWWSLGVDYTDNGIEIAAYSGPVASNGRNAIIKGHQRAWHLYDETWITVPPDTIIEKTFFVQTSKTPQRGHGFSAPLWTSLALTDPYNPDGFPPLREAIRKKLADTESRWREGPGYAGIKSFPEDHRAIRNWIDLAWAGQSEAYAYPYLRLADRFEIVEPIDRIQRGYDFITTSPFTDVGFSIRYDFDQGEWQDDRRNFLSQSQAMNNMLDALRLARADDRLDTGKWETFLQQASDLHAERILARDWHPVSTNEGFMIAPLAKASQQFDRARHLQAAIKAADHYMARHLSMDEPYWGGTLDARCEDKEGAWAALQGFLTLYDVTGDERYLHAAIHAGDVVISYVYVWDVPLPPGRLTDHNFRTRGWTTVSAQNMHLDVYGVLCAPALWRLGDITGKAEYHQLARLMIVACCQMIDPFGRQGEQMHQTNYAQHYDYTDLAGVRGDYVESWDIYWISAHFLVAAAQLDEMGVDWIDW